MAITDDQPVSVGNIKSIINESISKTKDEVTSGLEDIAMTYGSFKVTITNSASCSTLESSGGITASTSGRVCTIKVQNAGIYRATCVSNGERQVSFNGESVLAGDTRTIRLNLEANGTFTVSAGSGSAKAIAIVDVERIA